jgi:hypothetical protein
VLLQWQSVRLRLEGACQSVLLRQVCRLPMAHAPPQGCWGEVRLEATERPPPLP